MIKRREHGKLFVSAVLYLFLNSPTVTLSFTPPHRHHLFSKNIPHGGPSKTPPIKNDTPPRHQKHKQPYPPSTTSTTTTQRHVTAKSPPGVRPKIFPDDTSPEPWEVAKWLTTYGERTRAMRRSYYTAADWVMARRPDRNLYILANTFNSPVASQIGLELTFLGVMALYVCVYNALFTYGWDDFSGVHHDILFKIPLPALQIPMNAQTVSVSALGLLLTFRTNVCYQRWNEARTAWGKVINDSRSIVRMGCTWAREYNPDIEDAKLRRLGEAVCSFSRTLQNRVLTPFEDEEEYRRYLEERLTDQEYARALRNAKHRPTCALAEITKAIMDLELDPIYQVEVERPVTGLCDALGASERIFTSPIPNFYTRHTARFVAFWLLGLPLALYEPFKLTWNHWGMIPATLMISGALLGIEELAVQMEEPFSILPMEKMCEGSIRTPVMEQVEYSSITNQSRPRRDRRPMAPPQPQAPFRKSGYLAPDPMTAFASSTTLPMPTPPVVPSTTTTAAPVPVQNTPEPAPASVSSDGSSDTVSRSSAIEQISSSTKPKKMTLEMAVKQAVIGGLIGVFLSQAISLYSNVFLADIGTEVVEKGASANLTPFF